MKYTKIIESVANRNAMRFILKFLCFRALSSVLMLLKRGFDHFFSSLVLGCDVNGLVKLTGTLLEKKEGGHF